MNNYEQSSGSIPANQNTIKSSKVKSKSLVKRELREWVIVFIGMVPVFLAGMALGGYLITRQVTDEVMWAKNNQQEARWAMERQKMMNEAARQLFFEENKNSITVEIK